MAGSVKQMYLSELHQHSVGDSQSTLESFGTTETEAIGTTIAVVSDPTGGILDVTDEYIQELGMPDDYLNALRKQRQSINGTDEEKHNQAIEKLNLESKYQEYLETNTTAQKEVNRLVKRVQDGETITLVCFEKEPKWCHRFILQNYIQEKLDKQN